MWDEQAALAPGARPQLTLVPLALPRTLWVDHDLLTVVAGGPRVARAAAVAKEGGPRLGAAASVFAGVRQTPSGREGESYKISQPVEMHPRKQIASHPSVSGGCAPGSALLLHPRWTPWTLT